MFNFIHIFFISIFIENALFMRALGVRRLFLLVENPLNLLFFSFFAIFISFIHSSIIWFINPLFSSLSFYSALIPLIFIFCMTLAFLFIYSLLKLFFPKFLKNYSNLLISASFNTLIFGSLLSNFSHNYQFFESIVFAIGAQIGFIIAILLVIEGHRRLQFSSVPQSFKGIPIILIYIGILSLAFYGLVGHMLP